jgi:hypothetical protein
MAWYETYAIYLHNNACHYYYVLSLKLQNEGPTVPHFSTMSASIACGVPVVFLELC